MEAFKRDILRGVKKLTDEELIALFGPEEAAAMRREAERLWPTPNVPNGGRTTKGKHRPGETGIRKQALFATPQHHDHHAGDASRVGRFGTKHGGRNLNDEVMLWPTPRTEGFDAGAHRGNPDSLHSAVKLQPEMVPTPNARDHKDTGEHTDYAKVAARSKLAGTAMVDQDATTGLKLSAAWVGRLMMYPDDWMSDLPPDPLSPSPSPAPTGRRGSPG